MIFPLHIIIGIDTKIDVIVMSPTIREVNHSPMAKSEACGELPISLVTPQWRKSKYQFLFSHDATAASLFTSWLPFQWQFIDPFSWTSNWSQLRPRLQGDRVVGCITLTRRMTKFSASEWLWSETSPILWYNFGPFPMDCHPPYHIPFTTIHISWVSKTKWNLYYNANVIETANQ